MRQPWKTAQIQQSLQSVGALTEKCTLIMLHTWPHPQHFARWSGLATSPLATKVLNVLAADIFVSEFIEWYLFTNPRKEKNRQVALCLSSGKSTKRLAYKMYILKWHGYKLVSYEKKKYKRLHQTKLLTLDWSQYHYIKKIVYCIRSCSNFSGT